MKRLLLLALLGLFMAGCDAVQPADPFAAVKAQATLDQFNAISATQEMQMLMAAIQMTETAEGYRRAVTQTLAVPTMTAQANALQATAQIVAASGTLTAEAILAQRANWTATAQIAQDNLTATAAAAQAIATSTAKAQTRLDEQTAADNAVGSSRGVVLGWVGVGLLAVLGGGLVLIGLAQARRLLIIGGQAVEQQLDMRARTIIAERDQQIAVASSDGSALMKPGQDRELQLLLMGIQMGQSGNIPAQLKALIPTAPTAQPTAPDEPPPPRLVRDPNDPNGRLVRDDLLADDDRAELAEQENERGWGRALTAWLRGGEDHASLSRDAFCKATGCPQRDWRALRDAALSAGLVAYSGNSLIAQCAADDVAALDLPPLPGEPPDATAWKPPRAVGRAVQPARTERPDRTGRPNEPRYIGE